MQMKRRPDWEEMADRHDEYRCFLEFAYINEKAFTKFVENAVMKTIMKARKKTITEDIKEIKKEIKRMKSRKE